MSAEAPRRVLITGASSGIGRALALAYASRGAQLALIARRSELLEELAVDVRKHSGSALVYATDVADRAALISALKDAEAKLGGVDVAIANAGRGDSIEHQASMPDFDGLENALHINYLAAITTLTTLLPGMIERGEGKLAGVSSMAAVRGLAGSAGYTASKAALHNHLEALRVELRGTGVSVTTISPGFVATPMVERLGEKTPFVVSPERAAKLIVRAIDRRKRDLIFPWQMRLLRMAMRVMPSFLYDAVSARVLSDKRMS